MDTPAEMQRQEGYEAARAGRQESANPYTDNEMASLEWRKGFGMGLGEIEAERKAGGAGVRDA